MKSNLRLNAIKLRSDGLTYSEILKQVPVAKSTLSLWLRSVLMTKRQVQRITAKKLASIQRGGDAKRRQRVEKSEKIINSAISEVNQITKHDLWIIGTILYWAEGAKEKNYRAGNKVIFSNSDPKMIQVYLQWLSVCLKIPKGDIKFSLYIHQNEGQSTQEQVDFWNKTIGMRYNCLERVYFKRHNPYPKRKNINSEYHGQFYVSIDCSTDLNRRITGWIRGICLRCPVV